MKAEREAREEAERAAAERARNASTADQQIEQTHREHADELKALRGELDRQRTIGQRALAGVLFVLALAVAIVPLATGWISSGWPWVGILGAAGLIAYVGLALLFTKKNAVAIATAVVLAIGIANDLHGSRRRLTTAPGRAAGQ